LLFVATALRRRLPGRWGLWIIRFGLVIHWGVSWQNDRVESVKKRRIFIFKIVG
jgi:hypothetical protein